MCVFIVHTRENRRKNGAFDDPRHDGLSTILLYSLAPFTTQIVHSRGFCPGLDLRQVTCRKHMTVGRGQF